jgi:hypothetical protein
MPFTAAPSVPIRARLGSVSYRGSQAAASEWSWRRWRSAARRTRGGLAGGILGMTFEDRVSRRPPSFGLSRATRLASLVTGHAARRRVRAATVSRRFAGTAYRATRQ